MANAKVEQAFGDVERKIVKSEEAYRDSLKYYNTLQQELREASLEFNQTTRAAQEAKRVKLELEASCQILDTEFKVLTQTKLDQEKEVRDLDNKIEELRQAIASWESKQKSLEQSRKEDKDYVDEERKELASETRGVEKQFADDKRELINKMENAKYQVQKNFNEKLESHRRRFEKQVEELKRDQKQEYQSYHLMMTLKLENCQAEHADWQNKTEEAKANLREMRNNIARLEKNLRREILNDEVMGTSKIDELNHRSIPAAEKREMRGLDKKINSLRQKIYHTTEEVILCHRQREATELQLEELQREIENLDLAYTQMEQSKHALEERLTQEITVLENGLVHNTAVQVQYDSEIEKFEEMLNTVNEEAHNLRERHNILTAELKASKKASDTLGAELVDLLSEERNRGEKLDKEKRATDQVHHRLEKQHSECHEKIQTLTMLAKKQQTLFDTNIDTIDQLKAKNQKLEQAIRRLETRI